MKRILALLIFLATITVTSFAQALPAPFDTFVQELRVSVTNPSPGVTRQALIARFLRTHTEGFALYALGPAVYTSLVEANRLDKQIGTSASTAGSTSLVSHGSVPKLIGMAVESGALYQSVSGNIVTFRLNPSGLARTIANNYSSAGPPINAAALEKGLSRISGSASFDIQKGSAPGTFAGNRTQLKEASFRAEIVNKRDPMNPANATAINSVRGEISGQVQAVTDYYKKLDSLDAYNRWVEDTAEKLSKIDLQNGDAVTPVVLQAADEYARTFGSNPALMAAAGTIVDEIKAFRPLRNAVFDKIAKSSVLTFEYTFNKLSIPDTALASLPTGFVIPDTSTARLIYAAPVGNSGEVSLNSSVTFFNDARPEMRGNFRDLQFAGSLDFQLPELNHLGKPVLTFAGLGAFLHQQPFGVKVKVDDKETADGPIGVFQTKLTIPAGKDGMKIPLSMTFANRSEFQKEKHVRGSIGLTFDLDKLFTH